MNKRLFRSLLLSRYFPFDDRGAASQAISLANKIREHGHQVKFIARQGPELNPQNEIEGFRVTRVEAGRGKTHHEFRYWCNLLRILVRRRGDFDCAQAHAVNRPPLFKQWWALFVLLLDGLLRGIPPSDNVQASRARALGTEAKDL
jgi:hypothetical protein